jgi:hypothetical protein
MDPPFFIDWGIFIYYICHMYVIVKHVRVNSSNRSKKVPVILLNSQSEVWEFDTLEKAEEMKDIFQTNSDSGHTYEVKKI